MLKRLAPIRLLIALTLLFTSASAAHAAQDGLKGGTSDDEFPGLVEDGEYVSPQFDVGITWTDAWTVGDPNNPDVEHAIGGNYDGPIASDSTLGDIVFLMDTQSESAVLSLGMSPDEGPLDPDMLLAAMEQPEFLTNNLFLSEDAEVLLLDSDDDTVAMLAREAAPNDDHVVYMVIETEAQDAGYTFWVGLDMYDAGEYERILTSMDDDIDVDGHDLFPVFSVDDMLEATDTGAEPATEEPATEAPATEEPATEVPATEEPATEVPATEEPATEEPIIEPPVDGSPVASPAASLPGLNGPGDYVSPQHGVPVSWTNDWVLNPANDPAILSHSQTGVDEIFLTDAATGDVELYITIEPTNGLTNPDELLAAVSDPGYLQNVLGLSADATVVLDRTQTGRVSVVYVDPSEEAPVAVVLEAHVLDNDTLLFIELRTDPANLTEDVLDLVEDTIEAAGEDAMDILDADDVVAALP